MTDEHVIWMFSAGAGLCAVLMTVVVARLLVAPPQLDRRFADPPPRLWRWTWPLIRAIEHHLGTVIGARGSRRAARQLQAAGLSFALNPTQFVAGRIVAAALMATAIALAWSPRGLAPWPLLAVAAALGWIAPASWANDRVQRRRRSILRELPFFLDVMTLSIEGGQSLSAALHTTVHNMPASALREELERVLRDIRAGRTRAEALRQFAERAQLTAVSNLVAAIVTAEKQGANLGRILRTQAQQRRTDRFLRAEKLAMEAPVKLLLPLVTCIFPGTFAVLFFPIVVRLLREGIL